MEMIERDDLEDLALCCDSVTHSVQYGCAILRAASVYPNGEIMLTTRRTQQDAHNYSLYRERRTSISMRQQLITKAWDAILRILERQNLIKLSGPRKITWKNRVPHDIRFWGCQGRVVGHPVLCQNWYLTEARVLKCYMYGMVCHQGSDIAAHVCHIKSVFDYVSTIRKKWVSYWFFTYGLKCIEITQREIS